MGRFLALGLLLFSGLAFGAESRRSFVVTPTITADAYADADQIGVLQTLSNILPASGGSIELRTVALIDKAEVKHDLQILFFDRPVTVASADNAAADVADAQMAAGFIGSLSFAEADYTTLVTDSATAVKSSTMVLKGAGGTAGRNLYYLIICKDAGGCDYGATTDLVLRLSYLE